MLQSPATLVWGAEKDTVHHVWGLWWLLQPQADGLSRLVSFPYGERGSLLVPLGSRAVQPLQLLLGPVFAYNVLTLLYLLLAALGVGLFARRLANSREAGLIAALAMVVGRPLFITAAEGTTEGLALGWLALALWACLGWYRSAGRAAHGVVVGLLFGAAVLEDPYTLVVAVPAALGCGILRLRQPGWGRSVAAAVAAGLTLTLGWLALVGGQVGGNLGSVRSISLLNVQWRYIDLRSVTPSWFVDLVNPWSTPGLGDGLLSSRMDAGGRSYLGLGVLALALLSLRSRYRWLLLAAAFFIVLAMGSVPFPQASFPSPFMLLNSLLWPFSTLLSQPQRFLPLASAALAVAAGVGAAAFIGALPARYRLPVTVLLCAGLSVEAATAGGPSVRAPAIDTRATTCAAPLEGGAVYTHPRLPQPPLRADMLLQLSHHQPGTHMGIGGWREAPREQAFDDLLGGMDKAGALEDRQALSANVPDLMEYGIAWMIVPQGALGPPGPEIRVPCGEWEAIALSSWPVPR